MLLDLVAAAAVAQEMHREGSMFSAVNSSGLLFELFQIGVDLGRIRAGQLDDLGLEVVTAQIAQQHAPG